MKQDECPINWDDIFGRIGDIAIISEFAISFVKNSEKIIDSLESAVSAEDIEQIEMYAHALKGSASNMGAIRLAKMAWQLEKTASEKKIESAPDWVKQMKSEFEDLKGLLSDPDWIEKIQTANTVKP